MKFVDDDLNIHTFCLYFPQLQKISQKQLIMMNIPKLRQSQSQRQKKNIASSYNLIKNPTIINKFATLYLGQDKITKQIWHIKVINTKLISEYNMQECIQFNQQLITQLKEKPHIIYNRQIFEKDDKTFYVQQKYDMKLSQYMKDQKITPGQAQEILRDIFAGIVQIYEEEYFHHNLRPQHIVKVDQCWKIQSFVLDNNDFGPECISEFVWNRQYASPEQVKNKNNLNNAQLDAQIVWSFAVIGLQMVLGPTFKGSDFRKQNLINWKQLKSSCSEELYQMLEKCYKLNYAQRLKLSAFLNLKLFDGISSQRLKDYFFTQSKILKKKNDAFKQALNLRLSKSSNQQFILQTKLSPSEIIIFERLDIMFKNQLSRLQLMLLITQITKNLSQVDIITEQQRKFINFIYGRWVNFHLMLTYSCLKNKCYSATHRIAAPKSIIENFVAEDTFVAYTKTEYYSNSKKSYEQLKNKSQVLMKENSVYKLDWSKSQKLCQKQFYDKNIQVIKFSNTLTSPKSMQNSSSFSFSIHRFMMLISGALYNDIKKYCDSKSQSNKEKRIVCFFALCAFLIHVYSPNQQQQQQDFKQFWDWYEKYVDGKSPASKKKLDFIKYYKEANLNDIISHTQKLVKKHFQFISV